MSAEKVTSDKAYLEWATGGLEEAKKSATGTYGTNADGSAKNLLIGRQTTTRRWRQLTQIWLRAAYSSIMTSGWHKALPTATPAISNL